METITVHVNDKAVAVTAQSTLSDLIEQMALPSQGIAIAVSPDPLALTALRTDPSAQEPQPGEPGHNRAETTREVIPQQQWADYRLADRQDILIIQATQGG